MHKHAILLQVLAELTAEPAPLTVVDTHAGAGVYDLQGELARRSGEAEAGVIRLLEDPASPQAFAPLKLAVRSLSRGKEARFYPGSPRLIGDTLRPGDSYIGCELRSDDHAALARELAARSARAGPRLSARQEDGYAFAAGLQARGRTLIFIDPPYERGDDYARIVQALAAIEDRAGVSALVWAPIKDLETFDALLRGLEGLSFGQGWAAEVRLRPLRNPMTLNGAAMIGLGVAAPPGAQAICEWTAHAAGEAGGFGRVSPLFL